MPVKKSLKNSLTLTQKYFVKRYKYFVNYIQSDLEFLFFFWGGGGQMAPEGFFPITQTRLSQSSGNFVTLKTNI